MDARDSREKSIALKNNTIALSDFKKWSIIPPPLALYGAYI